MDDTWLVDDEVMMHGWCMDDVLLMHGICMNDGWCMNEAWVMDHAWIVNDAWVFRYPQPLIVLLAIVKVNPHLRWSKRNGVDHRGPSSQANTRHAHANPYAAHRPVTS